MSKLPLAHELELLVLIPLCCFLLSFSLPFFVFEGEMGCLLVVFCKGVFRCLGAEEM